MFCVPSPTIEYVISVVSPRYVETESASPTLDIVKVEVFKVVLIESIVWIALIDRDVLVFAGT